MKKFGLALLIVILMVATPIWLSYSSSEKITEKDFTAQNYYYSDSCDSTEYLCYNAIYHDSGDDVSDNFTTVYTNISNWSDISQKCIDYIKGLVGWTANAVSTVVSGVRNLWHTVKGWFS